jgi:hypothetical protein
LHFDLEVKSLVRWAYQIYLTDMTRASHFLSKKCWYSGEPEPYNNLRTSSFSSTNRLRILPLDNHLISECNRSDLWSACISSHKTANDRAFTKFTTFTASCNTECNFDSRSRDAKASLWKIQCIKFTWGPICYTSAWKPFLCPIKAAALSVQMQTQFAQEISSGVTKSFTALNISLSVHVSESGRQNMNSSWMFPSKQYLSSTSSWANPATSVDSSIWRADFWTPFNPS